MRHLRPAVLLTAFFIVLTGVVFPGVVWAFGQLLFPHQASGSFVTDARGHVVGSELIGQGFTQPKYFHPRPSAAGAGYDAANSGGTNLGPLSSKLVHGVKDDPATPNVDESYAGFVELARQYRVDNGLPPNAVLPADAATRSASGLDPDISPANAKLQVARVAQARGIRAELVSALVERQVQSQDIDVRFANDAPSSRRGVALDALM